MKTRLILFLLCFTCAGLSAQSSVSDSVFSLFEKQINMLPQEKIHLHIDKSAYIAGENIWFRAYLLDAIVHVPASASRYVYVELIDKRDSVACRVKIRPVDGAYYGRIEIPEDISGGDYQIRAYTHFMRNVGEDYFFSKTIRIGQPQDGEELVKAQKKEKIDLAFYPEGGYLLTGNSCRVAFKAMCSDGSPASVSGTLYNQKGEAQLEAKTIHQGMGLFYLFPRQGDSYYLEIMTEDGKLRKYNLPKALQEGYSLSVIPSGRRHLVSVVHAVGTVPIDSLYLIAHTRGQVHFVETWDHKRSFVALEDSLFPSGVLHLILSDKNMQTLSERLVFVNNGEASVDLICAFDRPEYKPRSKVQSTMQLQRTDGGFLKGSFSASVTDNADIQPDTLSSILTSLLLTSDLRGTIAEPAWYFSDDPLAPRFLDLLMLVQGWRRYNIPEVLQGKFHKAEFPLEIGPEISGKVESTLFSSNSGIEMYILSRRGNYFDVTKTGKNGSFSFNGHEFCDSTTFIVQTKPAKGLRSYDLTMDQETFPARKIRPVSFRLSDEKQLEEYMLKADQKYIYENGMRMINLSEVTVRAQRKERRNNSVYYSTPDNTISREDIEHYHPNSIKDLLIRIPGLWVSGNSVSIRGGGTPLLLIDGIPSDIEELTMMSVFDVDQIDVLKGAGASIFGSQGGNGVISVFTKRGDMDYVRKNTNIQTITPLGYQVPAEFYAPKYDTKESLESDTPDLRTTIHWEPVLNSDDSGRFGFDFYTADPESNYTLIVQGITDDGKMVYGTQKIVVRK